MLTKVFTVLALAIFAVCTANPTARVVGGKDAAPGQFPFQISLTYDDYHVCGGSIISEKYILTAAQCVVDDNLSPFPAAFYTIRAGTNNRIAGGVLHSVRTVIIHEGFTGMLNNLALLELNVPLAFTSHMHPIEMMTEEVPSGSDVIISGWGMTENNGADLPILLQYNTVEAISKTKCATMIGLYFDGLLCLNHEKDNGACYGDSGGPATYEGKLAGVGGFVVTGCGTSRPDGYAKVSHNSEWIRANMV